MNAPAQIPGARAAQVGERALLEQARAAAAHAHAPYSCLQVGAVAVGERGEAFVGVNVENSSYPVGMCAERVALGALVVSGQRWIASIAVAAGDGRDLLPCGDCLQALSEFGAPDVIAMVHGAATVIPFAALLPAPFQLRKESP